jgi:lysyl-tRNA synthetase class 2
MSWQPSASLDALKARAQFNCYIREFFAQRDVMEVETPALSQANVCDANLTSVVARCCGASRYLQTSPEYPMKRLLASGAGDIYQICKTFRDEEKGSRHNPEFTMLEYYRLGFDLKNLMDEVAQLVGDYLNIQLRRDLDYRQAMICYAKLDPFSISDAELRQTVVQYVGEDLEISRDACLDLIMSYRVEPNLPKNTLTFIYNYPGSQAALAKTVQDRQGNNIAKRFELYVNGLELANGYHELTDVAEQKRRFNHEALKSNDYDEKQDLFFLQALEAGLPECAGVALGLDRILMLKLGVKDIASVLSFEYARA